VLGGSRAEGKRYYVCKPDLKEEGEEKGRRRKEERYGGRR